jgi:outer membrane protein TolC
MFQQEGELARATLNTLMGRSPDAPLAVSGAYAPPTFLPDLPALEHVALNNRPELRAAASMLRRDQLAIDLARKAYTPDFEVGGGYMLSPSGMDDRNGYMAELVIGLPWLNRKKHDAEIARAGAAASVQEAEIENLRTVVRQEIQMALIRANTARKLVDVYASTLRPQAQATLKSATAAYQADRTDFLNLIDSQNTLLEVEYSYYRALAELETRWAELELAVGTTIERHPATAEVRQ